jgi:signal transduction histidine kinase/ligand-binding sensor domain-containing protein
VKTRLIIALLPCLLLIPVGGLNAQPKDAQFRYLGSKDGLLGSSVYSIVQSKSGFMWLSVYSGGLYRYDGYSFRRYSSSGSDSTVLTDDNVRGITEDSSGMIWVGTNNVGLFRLEPNTGKLQRFAHSKNDTTSLSSNATGSMLTDSKGQIWVMTEAGLDMYDAANNTFIHYTYDKKNSYFSSSIYPGDKAILRADQHYGVVLSAGLDIFYPDDHSRTLKVIEIYDGKQRLGVDGIFSQNGVSIGVFIYRPRIDKEYKMICKFDIVKRKVVRSFAEFKGWALYGTVQINDSIYYLATTSKLLELNTSSGSVIPIPIQSAEVPSNVTTRISTLEVDHNKNVWIGTKSGGVFILERGRGLFVNHSFQIKEKEDEGILGFCAAMTKSREGKLLLATTSAEIYQWDTVKREFKYLYPNRINPGTAYMPFVNQVFEDRYGNVWTSCWNSGPIVIRNMQTRISKQKYYSPDTITPGPVPWLALDIYEDRSGLVWVGGGYPQTNHYSFACIDQITGKTRSYYLPDSQGLSISKITVYVFFEDKQGSLWLGTNNGLYLFDRVKTTFTRYCHNAQDPRSISSNIISSMHEDKVGRFWVGTTGGGLNLFDRRSGTFTHFSDNDGSSSTTVRSILEASDGSIWISTWTGIKRFDPEAKTFMSYDLDDGIHVHNFSIYASKILSTGEMFFGGEGGVLSFFPEEVSSVKTYAPLVITSFNVSGKSRYSELTNQDTIRLRYDEDNISFEFAAIDFQNPIKKRYAYKLDGLSKDWFDLGSKNFASFLNIPPGEYVFRVRAKTREGIWDPNEIAILIIITPPYWGTWWFRVSIALLVIGGITYFYRRREQSRKQHLTDLEAAREKERFDLASELHDGPLQDLYATRFIIDPVISQVDSNTQKLDELLQKVRSDLRTITSELQIPRFDLGFAEELRLYIDGFQEKYSSLRVIPNITKEDVPIDPKAMYNLFRIFRTALVNTAKHADATEVRIQFHSDSSGIGLTITDNGKGFVVPHDVSELVKTKHYGLFMMKSFAGAIGATCAISSEIGKGTVVSVSL